MARRQPREFIPADFTTPGLDVTYREAIPAVAAGDIRAIGVDAGQVGTGSTISDLIQAGDAEKHGYTWVHGPAINSFLPHEDLDGVEFESFDDSVLENNESWPDNDYFLPGDHIGCTCDFMPLWMSGGDQEVPDEAQA